MADYEAGLITLERLRGRCCYPKVVQAAEYFLRLHTGKREIEGLTLLRAERLADECYRISFEDEHRGESYRVHLGVDVNGVLTLTNCSDTERAYVPRYRLLGLETPLL